MPDVRVTVVIPTLAAGPRLVECLEGLDAQTRRDFEVVVVDNSGQGRVREAGVERFGAVIIENGSNTGFGAAINAGVLRSRAPFVAALNDDAVPRPDWLCAAVAALEANPEAGMCASQIRLFGAGKLDSAGMVIAADGTTKQRGHLEPPERYAQPESVLFPSACAAVYRRAMLEEIGLFDEDFFLYCEDSDLGLRGCWAGWKCVYAPGAVVEHHYSKTAGRASPLKAYYVERNRLFLIAKNFPLPWLLRAPWCSAARYFWHVVSIGQGRGAAAEFQREHGGVRLAWFVARAHAAALSRALPLWRKRRDVRRKARVSAREFARLLAAHSIPIRQVAAL